MKPHTKVPTIRATATPRPSPAPAPRPVAVQKKKRSPIKAILALVLLLIIVGASVYAGSRKSHADANIQTKPLATKAVTASPKTVATPAPANVCAGNTLAKSIIVSISKRHEWACENTVVAYDSAVITGMENIPADLTPVGTYHIYAKTTNIHLKGSDSTGSWDDPVSYWMPFLDNQYGTYGFHDATWRKDSDFGNIDPYSSQGSHGCVEQPLAAAKWFYTWTPVGTTVTVVS